MQQIFPRNKPNLKGTNGVDSDAFPHRESVSR